MRCACLVRHSGGNPGAIEQSYIKNMEILEQLVGYDGIKLEP